MGESRHTDRNLVCLSSPFFEVEECARSVLVMDVWSADYPFQSVRYSGRLGVDIPPGKIEGCQTTTSLDSYLSAQSIMRILETSYDSSSSLVAIMNLDHSFVFQSAQILGITQYPFPILILPQRGGTVRFGFNNIIIVFGNLPFGPVFVKGG